MCHSATRLSALPARVGAPAHEIFATSETFTFLRTRLAYLCTHATRLRMVVRGSQHEIGARLANLSAVMQQALVFWCSVFAAHCQAMSCGFETQRMTIQAVRNALPHFGSNVMFVHEVLLLVKESER